MSPSQCPYLNSNCDECHGFWAACCNMGGSEIDGEIVYECYLDEEISDECAEQ